MVLRHSNPWETEDKAELVSIGTHKLHVSTSGPARRPNQPAVIFFTGGGAPAAVYIRLQRVLSASARVYFYDRTGYDRSERGPNASLNAQQGARELAALLAAIRVAAPYVLIGHSYGAIAARAFAAAQPAGAVTGLVLAEPGTELMYQAFQPKIPPAALTDGVGAGIDLEDLTDFWRKSRLTEEEIRQGIAAVRRSAAATGVEDHRGGAVELARARQLQRRAMEPWPVSVIRGDWARELWLLYDAGVTKGQGSEGERAEARDFIDRFGLYDDELRTAMLRLSSCSRYVQYEEYGHSLPLVAPEIVEEEVRWVMEQQQRRMKVEK